MTEGSIDCFAGGELQAEIESLKSQLQEANAARDDITKKHNDLWAKQQSLLGVSAAFNDYQSKAQQAIQRLKDQVEKLQRDLERASRSREVDRDKLLIAIKKELDKQHRSSLSRRKKSHA